MFGRVRHCWPSLMNNDLVFVCLCGRLSSFRLPRIGPNDLATPTLNAWAGLADRRALLKEQLGRDCPLSAMQRATASAPPADQGLHRSDARPVNRERLE